MTVYRLETLDSILDHNAEFAVNRFKTKGSVGAMVVGYTPNNASRICIAGQFRDNEEKFQFWKAAALALAAHDADKYAILSECWIVRAKNPDKSTGEFEDLSKHPDRQDALTILAVTQKGAKLRSYLVEKGELQFLHDCEDVQGATTQLLLGRKLTVLEKKQALKTLGDMGYRVETSSMGK